MEFTTFEKPPIQKNKVDLSIKPLYKDLCIVHEEYISNFCLGKKVQSYFHLARTYFLVS